MKFLGFLFYIFLDFWFVIYNLKLKWKQYNAVTHINKMRHLVDFGIENNHFIQFSTIRRHHEPF